VDAENRNYDTRKQRKEQKRVKERAEGNITRLWNSKGGQRKWYESVEGNRRGGRTEEIL